MRTLSVVLAVAVAIAVGTAPSAVHAQAGQKGAGLAERIQDLNLTDAQEAQIAEIRKEYRPKVQEAGNKLREAAREEVEKILAVLKG